MGHLCSNRRTATARANGDGDDDEVDAPWLGAGWPVALALLDLTRKVDDDAEGDQSDGWEAVHRTAWARPAQLLGRRTGADHCPKKKDRS